MAHVDSHSDTSHVDTHQDQLHVDTLHSDIPHSDEAHEDVIFVDDHSDTIHQDHSDHSDTAHQDQVHLDNHSDTSHGDIDHADVIHFDSHSDISHEDISHEDTHTDSGEGQPVEESFNLGIPQEIDDRDITFGFNSPLRGLSIPNSLLASPGTAYIKAIRFRTTGLSSTFWTGNNDESDDFGASSGPDFSSAVESYSAAFTLTASHGSVSLSGPAAWGDTSEPYEGDLPDADQTNLATWLSGYTSGDEVTLTINDGTVIHQDSHSDIAHSDSPSQTQHVDGAHQDTSHSDVDFQDQHIDGPHLDTAHADGNHTDSAHLDNHSDTSHTDNPHNDVIHSDGSHSDSPHSDTHTNSPHLDIHEDSHTDVTTLGDQIYSHWLLEFKGLDFAVWSGDEDINYEGTVYRGAGRFMELSQLDYQIDQPNSRLTATLAAGSEEVQQLFVSDENIYLIEIQWIVSIDGGITFLPTGRRYLGRTNGPTYARGQYTIEIEPTLSDQFRQRPVYWSDEEQQAQYPGDLGLSFASALIDGVKKAKWPR